MHTAIEIFSHPALESFRSRLCFFSIILFRCVFFSLLLFTIDYALTLGTSPAWLSFAAVAGTIGASFLAFSRLRTLGLLVVLFLLYICFRIVIGALGIFDLGSSAKQFTAFSYLLHGNLIFLLLCLGALSTWLFWKIRNIVTFEALLFGIAAIYFLSGHRNFNFIDAPAMVSSLAWRLGMSNLATLIFLGAIIVVAMFLYLYIATLPSTPRAIFKVDPRTTYSARPRFVAALILLCTAAFLVYLVAQAIHNYYLETVTSRTANGVGQAEAIGDSPLGFHSALGSNNQPAGLVRFEGDYIENPFSPMIYFREGALSRLQGHELVIAGKAYDDDVSFTTPFEEYRGAEDVDLIDRIPITQSIFTLSEQKSAYALDYPLSISRLKNPAPHRFKAAYKVYSMAPAYALEDNPSSFAVGDPRWSEEERELYLTPHPDPRYSQLAQEIAAEFADPLEQAFTIIDHLNLNSIYTLTPNHDVEPDADPVAAFLFGDKRGYCVHFAHATVYMFRALGIPARIGTGYLTDLSQSRDGHVLLRMSDRHAWAEVYVTDRGWVPFDTQPEQVESHAVTQVDMNLLEELMGLVGPDEEILPEDVVADELNYDAASRYELPNLEDMLFPVLLIFSVIYLLKFYLRFSWLLPSDKRKRTLRLYRAMASKLHDLGYQRQKGETRQEFRERLRQEVDFDTLSITDFLEWLKYSQQGLDPFAPEQIQETYGTGAASLLGFPWFRRVLAALNPSSAWCFAFGGGW